MGRGKHKSTNKARSRSSSSPPRMSFAITENKTHIFTRSVILDRLVRAAVVELRPFRPGEIFLSAAQEQQVQQVQMNWKIWKLIDQYWYSIHRALRGVEASRRRRFEKNAAHLVPPPRVEKNAHHSQPLRCGGGDGGSRSMWFLSHLCCRLQLTFLILLRQVMRC